MYGHTGQPPGESDDHEIGEMAIHYVIIVAASPLASSNHAVRTWCLCIAQSLPGINALPANQPTGRVWPSHSSATEFESALGAEEYPLAIILDLMWAGARPEA